MRVFLYLALSLSLALCVGEAGARTSQLTPNATLPRENASTVQPAQQAEGSARERIAELERRNLILEAKDELARDSYDQFELGMAGLGVLITLLVVGFGFVTHRAAVNAARLELADVKDKLDALHKEASTATERALQAAESAYQAAESAKRAAEGAQTHKESALEASEKVKEAAALAERLKPAAAEGARAELSEAERQTVSEAASEVADKPESQWTADEFRVKILQAYAEEDWEEMRRLARGMGFLHGADNESLAFAMFQQAFAFDSQERWDEAYAIYDDMIAKFSDLREPEIREQVANALVNKGYVLGSLGKTADAVAVYDDFLSRFGTTEPALMSQIALAMLNKSARLGMMNKGEEELALCTEIVEKFGEVNEPEVKQCVAAALVNRGIRLGAMGRPEEEIADYDEVVSRFGEDEDTSVQVQVAKAIAYKGLTLMLLSRLDEALAAFDDDLSRFASAGDRGLWEFMENVRFNRACVFAMKKQVRNCIEALEQWKASNDGFDCAAIADDESFDGIRLRAEFVRYLRTQGCAV